MTTVTIDLNNTTVRCTAEQAGILKVLESAKSGFVTFHNYRSESGFVKGAPKVSTVTVNAKVSTERVYSNSDAELEDLTLDDVKHLLKDWKAGVGRKTAHDRDNLADQFEACKAHMLARNAGNGSASHKKAHVDHSVTLPNGIKVWLLDDADADGVRTVRSVNIQCLPVSETVHDAGERKPSNPGSKVQVDLAIKKVINSRKVAIKSYNPFKAESVSISGMVIE